MPKKRSLKNFFKRIFPFFFKKEKNKVTEFQNSLNSLVPREVQDLFNILANPDSSKSTSERFKETLGEPDEIETFEDNGMIYEKLVWHTENGDITSFNVKPISEGEEIEKELSLEEKLQKALDNENYEEAAKLRDQISEKNIRK